MPQLDGRVGKTFEFSIPEHRILQNKGDDIKCRIETDGSKTYQNSRTTMKESEVGYKNEQEAKLLPFGSEWEGDPREQIRRN